MSIDRISSTDTPSERSVHEVLLSPTRPGKRVAVIDVLRGFALFGVLFINLIDLASGPIPGDDPWWVHNPLESFATRFFITSRFRAIFGILFGIGIAMQIRRASERGTPFLGMFGRRMVILAGFGMLNFLFYRGDILTRYALVGMFLIPFERLPVRKVVAVAVFVFLAHAFVPFVVQGGDGPRAWFIELREMLALLPPSTETCDALRTATNGPYYASGTFWQVRMIEACRFPREASGWISRNLLETLLFFLLGLTIGKSRLFFRIQELKSKLVVGTVVVAVIGFPLVASAYLFPDDPDGWTLVAERLARTSGIALTALAYCGLLTLAFQTRLGHRLLIPLAAAGRMALTVYIGQHILAATLFQGWGLAWANEPLVMNALVPLVVVLFLAEVLLCTVWLRYFRYGPLEWIWRSLTYRKIQPFVR